MASSPNSSLFPVRLQREGRSQPWGVRLAGGCDLGAPLVVTRAQNGSPAAAVLARGDIIRKIAEFDARDLRHQDALNLFQSAGDVISLVVQRDAGSRRPVAAAATASVGGGPVSPIPPAISPLPTFTPPPNFFSTSSNDEVIPITKQPYRTTPLVLPGAKVKKEDNITECYLRHHPNPMMRAHPGHNDYYPVDVAMKQKVVNRQFNTPIGLYSEQNIVDTIHKQHGAAATLKPTVVYDPVKSETYKALQDLELGDTVHEVVVPPQPKVFTPNKKLHSPSSTKVHQVNPMGQNQEKILQSGSFNRLMHMVMNDY